MMVPNRPAVCAVAENGEQHGGNNGGAEGGADQRENCTMAAPVPRRRGPATDCTVS